MKLAKAFRKVLRDMVRRLADGEPVPEAALETINHLLRRRSGYSQISRRRGSTFARTYHSDLEDTNQLLGLLGKVASDLLVTCILSLVKKCQNPACVLYFYDTTKNHARHWCSMSLCGNRSKVAAHYHRHRKGKP